MNIETFKEKVANPSEYILPDDANLVDIWNKYVAEDDKSICGSGTTDINEINRLNQALIKRSGYTTSAPIAGTLVEIGSGYNSLYGLLNEHIKYYPCDIVQRTPMTIQIENGKLPFADNSIDYVVAINCLQHMTPTHRLQYIKEAYRILITNNYPNLFVTYNMQNDSYPYAITGDYLVPKVTKEEFTTWIDEGLNTYSSTFNYYNGMYGTWFIKQDK